MVIKASAAGEIQRLIAALGGSDDVRREAAIARLAIIGGRAVDRLVAAYKQSPLRDTRISILRALEATGDARAVPIARDAIAADGDLALAAVGVLRALLDSTHAPAAADSLDALVAAALDAKAAHRVRLAAFEALDAVPGGVRERVADALSADPDALLRARAANAPRDLAACDALWHDALEGRLPDHARALRDAVQQKGSVSALGALQKLIDVVRAHEGTLGGAEREEWRAVRGALHQALALRGSTVALYDLRESLEGAGAPMPASFLSALHAVGDGSCLEPIAAAHAASSEPRWRQQLADAFRAIVKRERVSKRHAVMKRITARWPEMTADQ